jgi:hypothetical protein
MKNSQQSSNGPGNSTEVTEAAGITGMPVGTAIKDVLPH